MALLLARGCDPNAVGGYYKTALQAASSHGHTETMALLLENGADVNAQTDEDGVVPLSHQSLDIKNGYTQRLLQVTGSEAWTKAPQENEHLIKNLLKERKLLARTAGPKDPLQLPSMSPEKRLAQKTLASPGLKDRFHCNALQAASAHGHDRAVRLLLDAGADPHARGGFYWHALHAASTQGHTSVVTQLRRSTALTKQSRPCSTLELLRKPELVCSLPLSWVLRHEDIIRSSDNRRHRSAHAQY